MVQLIQQLSDIMAVKDSDPINLNLFEVFEDAEDSDSQLTYTVIENTNSQVVTTFPIDSDNGILSLNIGAVGYSDLTIEAKDTEGNTVSDNLRVRVTGEDAFKIVFFPDTQNYSQSFPNTFTNMTQWVVDNKQAHKIEYVIHVGDIVNNNNEPQWENADNSLSLLDGEVPYLLAIGNHDIGDNGSANVRRTELYNQFFPVSRYEDTDTFGGVYDLEPDKYDNNYHVFTAPDGTKWLLLSIEFGPRDDVLRWANDVIETYADHRVIISTHDYMNFDELRHDPLAVVVNEETAGYNYGLKNDPQGANDGETMWRELISKNPNITMIVNGHIFGDGATQLVGKGDYGNPVFEVLVNYQNGVAREITGNGDPSKGGVGGNGAIRLLTIDPTENRLSMETYFVNLDEYIIDFRDQPELDREGLTGPYLGHNIDFENVFLGTPDILPKADAGDYQIVTAPVGENLAEVMLDGSNTSDPNDNIIRYQWTDADGRVIANGVTPTISLPIGKHSLNLTIENSNGVTNKDQVEIIVQGDTTLLLETFNDGNYDGWTVGGGVSTESLTTLATASEFNLPPLTGGDADLLGFPATNPRQGYLIELNTSPSDGGQNFNQYTIVYDLLIEEWDGSWMGLLQTNTANTNDGDIFLRRTSETTGAIGISGQYEGTVNLNQWHRLAFTFDLNETNPTLIKYIDGVKVGEQLLGSGKDGRWAIDSNTGFLVFADENSETNPGYVNSILFSDRILSETEISALGSPDADGVVDLPDTNGTSQFDFTGQNLEATFGQGTFDYWDGDPNSSTWIVKGTALSRLEAEAGFPLPEGKLYEQGNTQTTLIWEDSSALNWQDYVVDATLISTDDDKIGLRFYYQDNENYYQIIFDTEQNQRTLTKVKDGEETILATAVGGHPFNVDTELQVAIVGNEITITLDGKNIFGGAVVDNNNPHTQGTIALVSLDQESSIFDDIIVNQATVTANAGINQRLVETNNNQAVVHLNGESSFSPDEISEYKWTLEGEPLANGPSPMVSLPVGSHDLTLTVTDTEGQQNSDNVIVKVYPQSQVLLSEDFEAGNINDWTEIDEGELEGPSDWKVMDGRLIQESNIHSRQLNWTGASAEDPWDRGWSPLGDGWKALRKGTYVVYDDPTAQSWQNYSVETTISSPDNEGLGILFYYQDPDNYYKLELDGNERFVQLFKLVDGIETTIARVRNKYTPDTDLNIRVDIKDGEIRAFLNDESLFYQPQKDQALRHGTVALYSWASEGVSFDDVSVLDISKEPELVELPKVVTGTAGDDEFDSAFPDDKMFVGDEQILFTGGGDDYVHVSEVGRRNRINTGTGDDIVFAGTGNRIILDAGDDILFAGSGRGANRISLGAGNDQLWLTEDDNAIPRNPNRVSDFNPDEDVIGFANTVLSLGNKGNLWDYEQVNNDVIISAFGQEIAQLFKTTVTDANFVFA